MPNEYAATIERLFTEVEALPEKYRRGFLFVMRHYKVLKQICREEKMSEDKRRKLIEDANKKVDTEWQALVIFERVVNGN